MSEQEIATAIGKFLIGVALLVAFACLLDTLPLIIEAANKCA